MPKRNFSPENKFTTPKELVESFENASHGDMVEYANAQVERLGAVAQERFQDDTAWMSDETGFDGGKEFMSLIEGLKVQDHEPNSDEKLALLYMDSVIFKNESQAVINGRKISLRNGFKGRNIPEALQEQFVHEASFAITENEKYEENVSNGTNNDDSPAEPKDVSAMQIAILKNKGIINDALVAADELNKPSGRENAKTFFSEVTARSNGEENLSSDEFADLRVALFKDMRRNIRSARAYNRLAAGKSAPFLNDSSEVDAKKVESDIYELAAKNKETMKYVYSHQPEGIDIPEDEAVDDAVDSEELAQRLESIATETRQQTEALKAGAAKPSSMPPVRPQPVAPQGNQGTSPAADSPTTTRTSSVADTNPGASTTPAAQPNGQGAGSSSANNESGGNAAPNETESQLSAKEVEKTKEERRKLQQIRVENAAAALQASSLNRSTHLFANGEADDYGKMLHDSFGKEVYELMQFDRPKILDDPSVTQAEKNAYISKYAFDEYHKVAMATVESMGGEKDPKKRKRNARLLRLGGAGLGFLLGGPAGLAIGGAIGLGLSKGLDSEMKNREKLKNAVQRHEAQFAADNYLNTPDREGELYDEKNAFLAATHNLMNTFEHGLVRGRRRNIGKAGLQGLAWTAGTIFVAHEAAGALQYIGDQAYHAVAQASWSGTGVPWDGGVNPNFNYTMHEKPVSMKAIGGLWNVATGNPIVGGTVGAAILAGLGGIKAMQDGGPDAKKKKNNDRTRANAA